MIRRTWSLFDLSTLVSSVSFSPGYRSLPLWRSLLPWQCSPKHRDNSTLDNSIHFLRHCSVRTHFLWHISQWSFFIQSFNTNISSISIWKWCEDRNEFECRAKDTGGGEGCASKNSEHDRIDSVCREMWRVVIDRRRSRRWVNEGDRMTKVKKRNRHVLRFNIDQIKERQFNLPSRLEHDEKQRWLIIRRVSCEEQNTRECSLNGNDNSISSNHFLVSHQTCHSPLSLSVCLSTNDAVRTWTACDRRHLTHTDLRRAEIDLSIPFREYCNWLVKKWECQ